MEVPVSHPEYSLKAVTEEYYYRIPFIPLYKSYPVYAPGRVPPGYMFEHNGSVAALEDRFDERRLNDDYVPTGLIGYGIKTRAVPGHEFGLRLAATDVKNLIAFLRTL